MAEILNGIDKLNNSIYLKNKKLPSFLKQQFIISKDKSDISKEYKQKSFLGWYIGHCKSIPFTPLFSNTKKQVGFVLGWFQHQGSNVNQANIIDSDIYNWLYDAAGRFVVFVLQDNQNQFLLDAGGAMAAVFDRDDMIIASTTALLPKQDKDYELIKLLSPRLHDSWYPFGLTPLKNAKRLLPNHYLDLASFMPVRYRPLSSNTDSLSITDIGSKISDRVRDCIYSFRKISDISFSLTAGEDSRFLLSSVKDRKNDFHYYTSQAAWSAGGRVSPMDSRIDAIIADYIAKRFNLKHGICQFDMPTDKERDDWFDMTGECVGGRSSYGFNIFPKNDKDRILIRGIGAEVGKAFYWKGFYKNKILTAENILVALHFYYNKKNTLDNKILIDAAKKWLNDFKGFKATEILDYLYLEQRLGCWAGPLTYSTTIHKMNFWPLNTQKIYDLLIKLNKKEKLRQTFPKKITYSNWPELGKISYNGFGILRLLSLLPYTLRRVLNKTVFIDFIVNNRLPYELDHVNHVESEDKIYKKHILYISYDYPPRLGGQARLNYHVAAALKNAGYKVTVVTNARNKSIIEFTLMNRAKSAIWNLLNLIPKVGKNYDLIIAGESNFSGFVAGLYGILFKKPVINLCQGTDFNAWIKDKGLRGALNKKLFKKNKLTITCSDYTKELVEKHDIAKNPITIKPGVDTSYYKEISREDNELFDLYNTENRTVILTVSRLVKRKGIDLVIKALSDVDKDFLYFIVGDGPEKMHLEELVDELSLNDKVLFLGPQTDDIVLKYYSMCDFFIMTPYEVIDHGKFDYEGFGIVYLEANACGKPVIATKSGGITDAVKDSYSGLLVEQNNAEAIKDAILKLINDKTLYNQLSKTSLQWAKLFDWKVAGKKYIDAIENVLT